MSQDQPSGGNPKDAAGANKLPLSLWPQEATALGCLGMLEGIAKYGRNNFIANDDGVSATVMVDALTRHVFDWYNGEDLTFDTKNPHLANALASLAIIVKAQAHGKLIDDRNFSPSPGAYRRFMDTLTRQVPLLRSMFKDRRPKHYTIADNPPSDANAN